MKKLVTIYPKSNVQQKVTTERQNKNQTDIENLDEEIIAQATIKLNSTGYEGTYPYDCTLFVVGCKIAKY